MIHFSIKIINMEPIADINNQQWDKIPWCPQNTMENCHCSGISCAAFLQIGQYEGVCGMVPGMMEHVINTFKPSPSQMKIKKLMEDI